MKVKFVGDLTRQKLDNILFELSSLCESCGGKKLHFCIQKCCQGPSAILCLNCDQGHRLHRKNDLRLLFLHHEHYQPHSIIFKERMFEVYNFLLKQKIRCQNLIEKQKLMKQLYSTALHSLYWYNLQQKEKWLEQSHNLFSVQNQQQLHSNEIFKSQFQKLMSKICLYPKNYFNQIQQLQDLKQGLKAYHDNPLKMVPHSSQSVQATLSYYTEQFPESIEQFVRRTNIQRYIQFNPNKMESVLSNGPFRSKQVWNQSISQADINSSRVIVHYPWHNKKRYDCCFGDQVTELHTTLNIERLPEKLQSLSFLAWAYDKSQIRKDMSEFPISLKKLRLQQDMNNPITQTPYKLDHLRNLKYLVIVDNYISTKSKKKIIQFAIRNELNMLCFLNSYSRPGYKSVPVWYSKIETVYTHGHPNLARHYYIYKRKQLQITLICRKPFLRKSYWAENIINFANCQMQEDVANEFDPIIS